MYPNTDRLLGRHVNAIFIDENDLVFETDAGQMAYCVYGDCCSHSYFYDFHGVKKLLESSVVLEFAHVDDGYVEPTNDDDSWECIQAYGFKIVSEHPQFGEVTSVFSFRNSSNGYYGGWMEDNTSPVNTAGMRQLTDDFLGEDA